MINKPLISSCTVAFPKECNYATSSFNNSINASVDLIALSSKVLARDLRNTQCNSYATQALNVNAIATSSNISNAAIDAIKEKQKREELRQHIIEIGAYYGAEPEEIEEEFNGALHSHPLDLCLISYRNLAASVSKLSKLT